LRWMSVLYRFRPVPNLRVLPRRRRSLYDRTLQDALRPTVLLPERFGPSPPGLSPSAAASPYLATLSRSLRRASANYSIGATISALIPPLGIALRQTEFRIMMGAGERRMLEQSKEEASHHACRRIDVPARTRKDGGSGTDLPGFRGAEDAGVTGVPGRVRAVEFRGGRGLHRNPLGNGRRRRGVREQRSLPRAAEPTESRSLSLGTRSPSHPPERSTRSASRCRRS
jgi:hypothetical protein